MTLRLFFGLAVNKQGKHWQHDQRLSHWYPRIRNTLVRCPILQKFRLYRIHYKDCTKPKVEIACCVAFWDFTIVNPISRSNQERVALGSELTVSRNCPPLRLNGIWIDWFKC